MIVLSEKELEHIDTDAVKCIVSQNIIDNEKIKNADVIVCCRETATKMVDSNLPNLRMIQLTSAGFDNVPLDYYANRGILIANAGSVYSVAIAETVVYGMLQMAKRYRKNPNRHFFRLTRGYKYITELYEKNVVILGAGSIGTEVADRLLGFGMNVYGYDLYCKDKKQYKQIYRTRSELINDFEKFDYIVSTMPNTNETKYFVNRELLSRAKASAVFVNVGRRNVINEDDLFNALKRGCIGGAVLDMFEIIPNPFTNKFRRLNNVIVLPGVAAISNEVNERLNKHICNNILLLLNGQKPNNIINDIGWGK